MGIITNVAIVGAKECRTNHTLDCPPYHICIEGKCRELVFTDICTDISFEKNKIEAIHKHCAAQCAKIHHHYAGFTFTSDTCENGHACMCQRLK